MSQPLACAQSCLRTCETSVPKEHRQIHGEVVKGTEALAGSKASVGRK